MEQTELDSDVPPTARTDDYYYHKSLALFCATAEGPTILIEFMVLCR